MSTPPQTKIATAAEAIRGHLSRAMPWAGLTALIVLAIVAREDWRLNKYREISVPATTGEHPLIAQPSPHAQATVSYTEARKESGRQMSEKLRAEIRKEYPNGFSGLTKSEIEKMDKDKVALIAILLLEENRTLNSRLGHKVETPVIYTKK